MSLTLNDNFSVAKITYEWHCAACNVCHSETRFMPPGGAVYLASLPAGWAIAEDEFYCPAHKVQVQVLVDGVSRTCGECGRDMEGGRCLWLRAHGQEKHS